MLKKLRELASLLTRPQAHRGGMLKLGAREAVANRKSEWVIRGEES